MDSAKFGTMRFGHFRFGVYRDYWDRLKNRVERVTGTPTTDVTRRKLSLGSRDSVTNWRDKSYAASTVEMLIVPRSANYIATVAGTYVRTDFLGLTADGVAVGDEIQDGNNAYYEVKSVRNHRLGDSFSHRECDLTELPLHVASPGGTQPVAVDDARTRTKTFIETYVTDSSKAQPVMFAWPDYPIVKEFFTETDPAFGVFAVAEPNSTAMMDPVSQAPYGYEEHVPIYICAVDKHGLSGTKMVQHMENRLRSALETNPTGSLRSLRRRGDTTERFGSTTLYKREFVMTYRRDTT